MSSSWRHTALVAVFFLAAPIVFLALLRFAADERLANVPSRPEPIVVSVGEISLHRPIPLVGTPVLGNAPAVYASGASGVVTGVPISVGDKLEQGDPAYAVSGITIMAIAADTPFWRELSVGTTGPDVVQLRKLLIALGLEPPESATPSIFDQELSITVAEWARSLGRDSAQPFDPTWIVWLPGTAVQIAEINIETGQPAPWAESGFFSAVWGPH